MQKFEPQELIIEDRQNILKNFVEVKLSKDVGFKMVIETLSRIGVRNKKEMKLFPSCYLLMENDKNYIVHFKELFLLKERGFNNVTDEDIKRRNSIVNCLYDWKLIDLDDENYNKIQDGDGFVYVLPHKEKKNWKICHKVRMRYQPPQNLDGEFYEQKEN